MYRLQEGRTAFHHSIVHGIVENDLEVARKFILFGSDVNVKDEVSI